MAEIDDFRLETTAHIALLVDADSGAALLGISRRHFWALHSSGRLGPLPVKLGKRTMWVRAELQEWTASRCPSREQWLNTRKVEV
jgi:predicted DNA-binding transcriptional regulator AlpA